MKPHNILIIFTLVLLLRFGDGASTNRPESSELRPEKTSLPFDSLFSLMSYFTSSTSTDYDQSSNDDSCGDQSCGQDSTVDSSETIIIYDVEQQVLPQHNATNTTGLVGSHPPRSKRDAQESKQMADSSEGRHKEVRPYPGFFLGRKLWYAPLWFSIYYSFYLLCLVIRSISRHRIHYPALLPADATLEKKQSRQRKKLDAVGRRISDSKLFNTDRYKQYY